MDMDSTAVLSAKATTMAVLCIVSIIMGAIPIYLNKRFKWKTDDKIVKFLLGLGGGVLLCTTFLHMIPEVKDGLQILTRNGRLPQINFPVAELLVCAGFFIMYLVEELVHIRLKQRQNEATRMLSEDKEKNELKKEENCEDNLIETKEEFAPGHMHRSHSHGYGHGHTHIPTPLPSTKNSHEFIISSLKGLLIVMGLSIHELFEGLAIGLEGAETDVWYMFAAVSAHKFVIAFSIGVELVASITSQCLSMAYICIFAVVSPLGIGVGMMLMGGNYSAVNDPAPVFLQGIATGTLLYVVFFEILQNNRDGLRQYFAIFLGFVVMSGVQLAIIPMENNINITNN